MSLEEQTNEDLQAWLSRPSKVPVHVLDDSFDLHPLHQNLHMMMRLAPLHAALLRADLSTLHSNHFM